MRLLAILIFLLPAIALSQSGNTFIREGNKKFSEKKFEEAEVEYKKALEEEAGDKAKFNLAGTYYKKGDYQKATEELQAILNSEEFDKETISNAYYNLGNSMFKENKLDESIDAYKQALINNPKNENARYNLEMARRMKKQQEQQQQKNQNQDKEKDNKEKEEKKDKENKDNSGKGDNKEQENQKNEEQQNQEQQQQQNQNRGDKKEQQQQQQQQQQQEGSDDKKEQQGKAGEVKISKEDAQRLLNALQNKEKQIQKKVKKQKGGKTNLEKNW
jgi:Ca-activated chloride channel family protein